jgi:hypothetical protein
MSDDLFQGDQPEQAVQTFDALVGEGKRYQTNDDVAKAVAEKDRFIEQLKREAAEAREALTKRMNEETFVDRLEQLAKPPSPEVAPQADRRDEGTPAVTPELVDQIIEQREVAKLRASNRNAVSKKLAEVFGSDWKAKVQAKARELDVGTEYLTSVAEQSPAAFYNVMGIAEARPATDTNIAPPRSALAAAFQPVHTAKDYVYWQEQKKSKGEHWYYSIPVQQEIWREVKAQGEQKFYGRSS